MAYRLNYNRGVVICHGKCEWILARHISTNLHLNIKTYAKDKGDHSIQIASIMNTLYSKPFINPKELAKKYVIEECVRGRNRKLVNFKLFIIMDTDDCTEQQYNDFISKKMFEKHWLCEYIVPITNSPSLDMVLREVGLLKGEMRKGDKAFYYEKIFPINSKPISDDTFQEVIALKNHFQKSQNTNIVEYLDYCIEVLLKQT